MDNEKATALLEQQNRILSHIGLWITRVFAVLCVVALLQIIHLLTLLLA